MQPKLFRCMPSFAPHLNWIESQRDRMCRLVAEWSNINSGSYNINGLQQMETALSQAFAGLGGDMKLIPLPPQGQIDSHGSTLLIPLGRAISIRKRPDAPHRVFAGIHMDTVYPPDSPFQRTLADGDTLRGPGVADAKGGLAVMLVALEALERSPYHRDLGWEILINPDEEIGSPGSAPLFVEAARRNQLGLIYEPALPDGTLVGQRRGSGNFTAVVRGRAAHAGRDYHLGRNAIHALADFIVALNQLAAGRTDLTISVGKIEGGGPVNVVPALAICRFNVRFDSPKAQHALEEYLQGIAAQINQRDGISLSLHGGITAPPKPLDDATLSLLEHIAACGKDLGLDIHWKSSGGVSDGNRLAAAGLPTVDTLGVRGGDIHSDREYCILDSLTERAALSALLLMKLGSGALAFEGTTSVGDKR